VILLTRDDTLTASINSKTQSKLITSQPIRPQLSMTDEFKGVTIAPLTTSTYASWSVEMEALLNPKSLWKCIQALAQDFMTTLGTLTLKENDEIETKFDKALGTIQCFLDATCKEIARGSLTAKDVWKTLKDQLEGQESYTKIYLLTLLYTTKLE